MASIAVPCPQCKKKLKLRDESLLGKKARCPNCKHAFVLELPESPPIIKESAPKQTREKPPQIVTESAPEPTSPVEFTPQPKTSASNDVQIELAQPEQPIVGTSVKWVPDDPVEIAQPTPAPVEQPSHFPQVDQNSNTPHEVQTSAPIINTEGADPAVPNIQLESTTHAGVARLQELRRKNAKRRNLSILIGLIFLILVGVGGYFAWPKVNESLTAKPVAPPVKAPSPKQAAITALSKPSQEKIPSPTSGEPIRLLYVPAGTRIVIHLRPADLWTPGSQGEEFRACLGPVGIWAEQKIKEICLKEPSQIEELTFCLILGAPGAPPEYAAVVRTTESFKRSELINQFEGQQLDDYSFPIYMGEKHSSMIVDENTYVIGPPGEQNAIDMAESRKIESSTSPGIESILKQTDRDRHLTIVFDPDELRRQKEVLVPEKTHPFLIQFLDWIGDDIETVAWSMHLGAKEFYSSFTFRNTSLVRPSKLAKKLNARLKQLPHEMLEGVKKMNPRTVGRRKAIGRFPAMLKAFSLANQEQSGERYVQLISILPERAAPNLAVASVLTWDESTRTDFSTKAKPAPTAGPKLPDLVVDRLKTKIEFDFSRTPLQEVLDYIADETKTTIVLNGPGFELVGYTKNMRQTLNLGMVSGLDAIHAIFNVKDQEKMCLIIDESKKTATVTSIPYAKKNNWKPFVFPSK